LIEILNQNEKHIDRRTPKQIVNAFFHLSRSIPFLLLMSFVLMLLTDIEQKEEEKNNDGTGWTDCCFEEK
jgi:hypothetical protein